MRTFLDYADIIHAYTRRQAIEDGVLVDLRQGDLESGGRQGGFLWPIACTSTVFHECIQVTPAAARAATILKDGYGMCSGRSSGRSHKGTVNP